jgi:hypothetical protein
MGHEKEVGIHVREFTSQTSVNTTKHLKSSHGGEDPPRAPWPSQPVPLKETTLSKWVNIVYDVALCGAPLLLLTKVGLVLKSAHDEKILHSNFGSVNTVANPSSRLTRGLIDFNSQVRVVPLYNHALLAADEALSWSLCSPSFL